MLSIHSDSLQANTDPAAELLQDFPKVKAVNILEGVPADGTALGTYSRFSNTMQR